MKIIDLLQYAEKEITVKGWIKTNRGSSKLGFITLYDGSSLEGAQVVYKNDLNNFDEIKSFQSFASVEVTGVIKPTPDRPQPFEILASDVKLITAVDEDFPIQNKKQTLEFLRENYHLRPRTSLFRSVFTIRSEAMFLVDKFYNENGFTKVSTPLITENDAEGAGETFIVTTVENGDYKEDFFGKKASLTVSGQLAAEGFAQSMGDVYTFGPTFRAENSNTVRHIAEFWMLEPEMAFANKNDGMDNGEELLKFVTRGILEKCDKEISFLDKFHEELELRKQLELIASDKKFARISYKEAIEILAKNKDKFEEKDIKFGLDLGTEHEKFLADEHFGGPVYVYDYPASIKAFYMYLNDDNETVAGYDLLVPTVGELIGGSQRETRLDVLERRAKEINLEPSALQWYFDLRRYGMAPSTGFGLGFERLVMLLTGMSNIRDTIPFPRTPKNLKF